MQCKQVFATWFLPEKDDETSMASAAQKWELKIG